MPRFNLSPSKFDYASTAMLVGHSVALLTQSSMRSDAGVRSFTFLGTFFFDPEPISIETTKQSRLGIMDISGAGGDNIQHLGLKSPLIVIKGEFFRDYVIVGGLSITAQMQLSLLCAVQRIWRRSIPFYASATGDFRLVYVYRIKYNTIPGRPGDIAYEVLLIQDISRGAP